MPSLQVPSSSMIIKVHDHGSFISCFKPVGLNTHAVDIGKPGLVELLEAQLNKKLYVVHRLDQETSGVILFAKSAEVAERLTTLFKEKKVQKKYLFLTTASHSKSEFIVQSFIEKQKNQFVSKLSQEVNAITSFRFVKKTSLGFLWEAAPLTGKPHQIRLHAQDQKIPILGDDQHGGSTWPRLALHAQAIEWTDLEQHFFIETTLPAWVEDQNETQALVKDAFQQRLNFLEMPQEETIRLCHFDVPYITVDKFGSQLVISWYKDRPPQDDDLEFYENLGRQLQCGVFIRMMQNKGKDPLTKTTWELAKFHSPWTAQENKVHYILRTDAGQSPGLFLDQRENRLWIKQNSFEREVLNLFAYTGGFSVCAALGGAKSVCTVDVSEKFNNWTKENFKANDLDPTESKYEFWSQDCLLFLKGALKRKRLWDLVICDPPSFGRHKDGVFQIQKNIYELIELSASLLRKDGLLLLSTNYEHWTTDEFAKLIKEELRKNRLTLIDKPLGSLDFEKPTQEALLKFIIAKKI